MPSLPAGTPVLVATNGTKTYVANLLELNVGDSQYYWKILSDNIVKIEPFIPAKSSTYEGDIMTGLAVINQFDAKTLSSNVLEIYKRRYRQESLISESLISKYTFSNVTPGLYYDSISVPSKELPTTNSSKTITIEPNPIIPERIVEYEPVARNFNDTNVTLNLITKNMLIFKRVSQNSGMTWVEVYERNGTTYYRDFKNVHAFRVYKKIENGKLIDFEVPHYCYAQLNSQGSVYTLIGFYNYYTLNTLARKYLDSMKPGSGLTGQDILSLRRQLAYEYGRNFSTIATISTMNINENAYLGNDAGTMKVFFLDPPSGTSDYILSSETIGMCCTAVMGEYNK